MARLVKIDRVAKRLVRFRVYDTMAEARAEVTRGWKMHGRLRTDSPEPDGSAKKRAP